MSDSKTVHLGPNDQETVEYDVSDATDRVLVSMKSTEHDDVTTIPTWDIAGEEFPEDRQPVGQYPARLEPLGDTLYLKIRNDSERETGVTVGFREKKLVSA